MLHCAHISHLLCSCVYSSLPDHSCINARLHFVRTCYGRNGGILPPIEVQSRQNIPPLFFVFRPRPYLMAGLLRTFCRSLWRQGVARKTQSAHSLSIGYSQGVRRFSSASEDLEKAKARLSVLTEDPGNEAKLKLYGLYKQVRGAPLGMRWLATLQYGVHCCVLLTPSSLRPPLAGAPPSSLECWTWLGERSGMLGTALGSCHRFVN